MPDVLVENPVPATLVEPYLEEGDGVAEITEGVTNKVYRDGDRVVKIVERSRLPMLLRAFKSGRSLIDLVQAPLERRWPEIDVGGYSRNDRIAAEEEAANDDEVKTAAHLYTVENVLVMEYVPGMDVPEAVEEFETGVVADLGVRAGEKIGGDAERDRINAESRPENLRITGENIEARYSTADEREYMTLVTMLGVDNEYWTADPSRYDREARDITSLTGMRMLPPGRSDIFIERFEEGRDKPFSGFVRTLSCPLAIGYAGIIERDREKLEHALRNSYRSIRSSLSSP